MCGMSRSMWYGYLACKKKREEREERRKRNDEKIMTNMRAVLKSFHGVIPGARTFRLFFGEILKRMSAVRKSAS